MIVPLTVALFCSSALSFELFGPGFTLLTAETAPSALPKCAVHVLSNTTELTSVYGLERDGCALVRPDGYVAVRWRNAPLVGCNRASLGDRIWPIRPVRFIQRTGEELE
jgi:hypothetical protein